MPNRNFTFKAVNSSVLRRSPRFSTDCRTAGVVTPSCCRRSHRFSSSISELAQPTTALKSARFSSSIWTAELEQPTTALKSARFSSNNSTPEPVRPSNTRKSPRFLPQNGRSRQCKSSDSSNSSVVSGQNDSLKSHKDLPENSSRNSGKTDAFPSKSGNSSTGSRKSPRLNNEVEELPSVRRSSRLSNRENVDTANGDCSTRISEKSRISKSVSCKLKNLTSGSRKSPRLNNGVKEFQNCRTSQRHSSEQKTVDVHSDRVSNELAVKDDLATEEKNSERTVYENSSMEVAVGRKRKRGGDDGDGHRQGWTREQEAALQRAYYAAKPTPHFWKKVSKLVPGKSAQDCFDKVHADHLTPIQPRPRSRAKRMNSSLLEQFSLSTSKILKLNDPKAKRSNCYKQKSHLTQRTIRHLLQKNSQVDKDGEADIFSLLEPNLEPIVLSTPKHLKGNPSFLQKCHERSSSRNCKKPLSRFSSLDETVLVSPPVLKQVKNKVLHEKYIDQLHCREAKRKAASTRSRKSTILKEDIKDSHVVEIDVVRAAKNALVCDARDAISHFQHLEANALSNSTDFDDSDVYDVFDDENGGE